MASSNPSSHTTMSEADDSRANENDYLNSSIDLAQMNEDLSVLENRESQLIESYKELTEMLQKKKTEYSNMEKEINGKEVKKEKETQELKRLTEKNTKLQKEIQGETATLKSITDALSNTQETILAQSGARDGIALEKIRLAESISENERLTEKVEKDIEENKIQYGDLNGQLDIAENRVKNCETSIVEYKQRIKDTQDILKRKQKNVEKYERQIEGMESKDPTPDKRIENTSILNTVEANLKSIEQTIQEQKDHLSRLEKDVGILRDQRNDLSNSLLLSKAELTKEQNLFKELTEDRNSTKNELSQIQNQMKIISSQIQSLDDENTACLKKSRKTERSMEERKLALNNWQERKKKLQKDSELSDSPVKQAEKLMAKAKVEKEQAKSAYEKASEEATKIGEEWEACEEERRKLRQELDAVKDKRAGERREVLNVNPLTGYVVSKFVSDTHTAKGRELAAKHSDLVTRYNKRVSTCNKLLDKQKQATNTKEECSKHYLAVREDFQMKNQNYTNEREKLQGVVAQLDYINKKIQESERAQIDDSYLLKSNQDDLGKIQEKLLSSKNQLEKLEEKTKTIQGKLTTTNSNYNNCKDAITMKSLSINMKQQQFEEKCQKKDSASALLLQVANQLQENQKNHTSLLKTQDRIKKEHNDHDISKQVLKDECTKEEKSVDRHQKQLEGYEEAQKDKQNELLSARKDVSQIKEDLQSLGKEKQVLYKQLEEYKEVLKGLKAEHKKVDLSHDELKTRITHLQEQMVDLNTKNTNTRLAELMRQLKTQEEKITKQTDYVRQWVSHLQYEKGVLGQLGDDIRNEERRRSMLDNEIIMAKKKTDKKERKIADYQRQDSQTKNEFLAS